MAEYQTIRHPFQPVYDERCRILFLGSLPSVKSRENQFYYGHPRNRCWKVLAAVYKEEPPESIQEKQAFLLRHHIALWDVVAQCDICGSSDSSIKNIVPNDITGILKEAPVEKIITNGSKADELYRKYCQPLCAREAVRLPSTSPANAAWRLGALVEEWRKQLLEGA